MQRPFLEVHFLDVGQGSSAVILFWNSKARQKEAIIIDCGRSSRVLAAILSDFKIAAIRALILTHNHDDHAGGLELLLKNFKNRLLGIYLVRDTDETCRRVNKVLLSELSQEDYDRLVQPLRVPTKDLARGVEEPDCWYTLPCESTKECKIFVRAPKFSENLSAEDPNQTSGVVEMLVGEHRLLFSGDATLRIWNRLQMEGKLECLAVTVPHHGGKQLDESSRKDCTADFFQKSVRTKHAIFSFSSCNPYSHPARSSIEAAHAASAQILCTQISPALNKRSDVIRPTRFSKAGLERHRSDRKHFACAGSITLGFSKTGKAYWGHQDYPNPICGFRDLDELAEAIKKHHGGDCQGCSKARPTRKLNG